MPEPAGLPAAGPATLAGVKAMLSITTDAQDDVVEPFVNAANVYVRQLRSARAAIGAAEWPADIVAGAELLAARLYKRKGNATGVDVIADVAVYVSRNDPDVAMLLKLGSYAPPAVG